MIRTHAIHCIVLSIALVLSFPRKNVKNVKHVFGLGDSKWLDGMQVGWLEDRCIRDYSR